MEIWIDEVNQSPWIFKGEGQPFERLYFTAGDCEVYAKEGILNSLVQQATNLKIDIPNVYNVWTWTEEENWQLKEIRSFEPSKTMTLSEVILVTLGVPGKEPSSEEKEQALQNFQEQEEAAKAERQKLSQSLKESDLKLLKVLSDPGGVVLEDFTLPECGEGGQLILKTSSGVTIKVTSDHDLQGWYGEETSDRLSFLITD